MDIYSPIIARYKTFLCHKLSNYRRNYRRKKLNKTRFTIISNNCWGGGIYESYNLVKQSPTIGMYILPGDYLKFISNIKHYLHCKLEFIDPNCSENKEYIINNIDRNYGSYPVGVLDDIEIYFMHYKNREIAKSKWKRRIDRICWDHIIFKFNDQNGCTNEQLIQFAKLPLPNKIAFTVRDGFEDLDSIIKVNNPNKKDYVEYSNEPFGQNKYFNVNKFINRI